MAAAARWDIPKSISISAPRDASNALIAAACTCSPRAPLQLMRTERSAVMKQLGAGWNWKDLTVGEQFVTGGRTIFEADVVNFVALSGMAEELFTNKEYIASHAAMRCPAPWFTASPRAWCCR